jgi:hypothetical protein
MTENEQLGFGARRRGRPHDAEVISTMFLSDHADESLAIKPEVGEEFAATIGRFLLNAGRFMGSERMESVEHVSKARTQEAKKSLGEQRLSGHVEMMVTIENWEKQPDEKKVMQRFAERKGRFLHYRLATLRSKSQFCVSVWKL